MTWKLSSLPSSARPGGEGGGDARALVQRAGDHAGDELGRRLRRLDEHRRRRQRALGEVLLQQRVALLGRHVLQEVLGEAEARAVEEAAERQDDEDREDSQRGPARPRGHPLGDAAPRLVLRRLALLRHARPEGPAAEQREQRRHQRQPGDEGHEDADAEHRRERAVVAVLGEEQREHRQGHRQAAGGDRLPRLAQRRGERDARVALAAQVLAVARDEEQAVVGPGAEQQDHHERRRLPGEGRPGGLGDQREDAAGDEVAEARRR